MRVRMLGCGPSGGVPRIGGIWGACDPAEPRNRRRRVSILVEEGGRTVLVDTAPDLREQLLEAGTSRIDAVVFTHSHADHLHGIDDLRSVNRLMQRPIPAYAAPETLAEIERRFDYVFGATGPDSAFYQPLLTANAVTGPFEAAGMAVVPFRQSHGFSTTLGLRIGAMAYSTDVVDLDETAFAILSGVELWIVDCLRREPHPTHSHLAKTLDWIARVKPRRAALTHMDVGLDYATLRRELPPGIEPGYDGLEIEVG